MQIAKHALGKYIICSACLLHLWWALVIIIDLRGGNATPVSIFFAILYYRWLVIAALVSVSFLAGLFLDFRLRKSIPYRWLTLLLIPQQLTLLCSAGIGLHCVFAQHYSDGTIKSWAHIANDQAPVIIMAILYTTAVLETIEPPS